MLGATAIIALVYLTGVAFLGCQPSAGEVTFDELFSNPQRYNGRSLTIEGFYFHGFEVIVVTEELAPSGYAEGYLIPKGRMLWVEGGIPLEIYNRLYTQSMMGPTERYGRVRITGRFSYGGQYGHVGGYDAQITPSEVELLEWAP